jgi:hypothetical protein
LPRYGVIPIGVVMVEARKDAPRLSYICGRKMGQNKQKNIVEISFPVRISNVFCVFTTKKINEIKVAQTNATKMQKQQSGNLFKVMYSLFTTMLATQTKVTAVKMKHCAICDRKFKKLGKKILKIKLTLCVICV